MRRRIEATRTRLKAKAFDAMASGEAALLWKQDKKFQYVIPAEGAHQFLDVLAIPANARNKDAAHAFVDFVLRPHMMAAITKATRYPNAVPATRALLPQDLLADANVFPDAARMAAFSPARMSLSRSPIIQQ